MNSKILLTNYPRIYQPVQFEQVKTKKLLDVVVGYDIQVNKKLVTERIASDLITALLLYDTIYVEGNHIRDIIQVWGSDYMKQLLSLNLVKIIPDQNLNPAIKKENDTWEVGFFAYPQRTLSLNSTISLNEIANGADIHKWSHIENKFSRMKFSGPEAKTLLYLIDENSVNLDEEDVVQRINKETTMDLGNTKLLEYFNLIDPISGKLEGADFPKLLRLQELNKAGVLASALGIDSIKADAEISTLLTLKTLSSFNKKYSNGVDVLNKIEYQKGIPDLGKLFVNETIGLDEILKLRESFQGNIFRYWAQHNNYEEDLMRREIMNSTKSVLGNRLSNGIRIIACNLIGVAGFLPGMIASTFDSFILNKIVKGWHPNFFLDDHVKSTIDRCIAKKEMDEKRERIREAFADTGRNDPCPCNSGKKFKNCHGKIL